MQKHILAALCTLPLISPVCAELLTDSHLTTTLHCATSVLDAA